MNTLNWTGLWTLYTKEVHRFLKVYHQTLLAPAITSLLFLAIFSLAVGRHVPHIGTIPFMHFMASGLIIMSVIQNAFANTSSTLIMGKVLGIIIDYLMPPLSAGEVILALVGGAVTRGILIGIIVTAIMWIFVPFSIYHIGYVFFHIVAASTLLALLGILAGIFANTFDQMSAITSYIIIPLSFLSGTFYSVKNLPETLQTISHFNPLFYSIDGFRYGMTGYHDSSLMTGVMVLLGSIIILWSLVYAAFHHGYRLKT